jgi:hypothetical protein
MRRPLEDEKTRSLPGGEADRIDRPGAGVMDFTPETLDARKVRLHCDGQATMIRWRARTTSPLSVVTIQRLATSSQPPVATRVLKVMSRRRASFSVT